MDELLMGIQSTVKASMAESATMSILHTAMIKAHEKVRSKEGVIERLNEQSKFCELAIMQLEACLMLVQEEAGNYVLENDQYDRLLPDLTLIKDRLYGRLRETETAIHDKDKELLERRAKERRLRQALDAKEKELERLRNKSCNSSSSSSTKDNDQRKEEKVGGGGFCELKNSVDQQVLSIKQHLEGEKIAALTRRHSLEDSEMMLLIKDQSALDHASISSSSSTSSPVKGGSSGRDLEMGFDQMGLEIDRLKQTVDTAFGMMQYSNEVHPLELQWTRGVENDIQLIVFKDVVVGMGKKFCHPNAPFGMVDEDQWLEFVKEVTLLRNELEGFVCSHDEHDGRKSGKFEGFVIKDDELKKHKDQDLGQGQGQEEKEDEEGGSPNSVSKMIKTHEKLIRKKSEEMNWVKAMEMVKEKGPLSPRRSKLIVDTLKKRSMNVVKRLDGFLLSKGKFDALLIPNKVEEQVEDSKFQSFVIEGIYICLFKSLTKEFELKLDEYDMRNSIYEDMFEVVFNEVVKEIKLNMKEVEDYRLENLIKDDICRCVFVETVKDFKGLISEKTSTRDMHEESLIQKLNSLLCDAEISDIWMHNSEVLKDEKTDNLDCFSSEISEDDEMYFKEVRSKLEHALHQLGTTKAMLTELTDSEKTVESENIVHDKMKLHFLLSPNEDHSTSFMPNDGPQTEMVQLEMSDDRNDREIATNPTPKELSDNTETTTYQNSFELISSNQIFEAGLNQSDISDNSHNLEDLGVVDEAESSSIEDSKEFGVDTLDCELVSSLLVLSQVIVDFEGMLQEKLHINYLRLQKANNELRSLHGHISSLKKNESLYKEAFIIRCQNLHKAESEVDILGDQVDALTSLLQRIYSTLHYYSPVLQHFTGVMDILIWIRKELNVL